MNNKHLIQKIKLDIKAALIQLDPPRQPHNIDNAIQILKWALQEIESGE